MAMHVTVSLIDLAESLAGPMPLSAVNAAAASEDFTASGTVQSTTAASSAKNFQGQAWEVVVIAATDGTDSPIKILEGETADDPTEASAKYRVISAVTNTHHFRCSAGGKVLNFKEFTA
jgi:hypothetical protein